MGSKKKAPPPPDYKALAEQQAALQNQMLQTQTEANRPDQISAMGSLKWSQDPATGRWTQTEELNPEARSALDQALALQTEQIGQIGDLMGEGRFKGGPQMPTYDPASGEQYAQRFTESLMGRLRPQQAMDQEQMTTKLRLQGLQPGTEAYNRAYQNLLTSQGDVNTQANLQGLLAGGKEARDIYTTQLGGQQQGYTQELQNYLLPWETAAKTQGIANQIKMPSFAGFSQAGVGEAPKVMDAAQQQYAQQMQQYNEAAQSKQGKGQAIGSLAGTVGGAMFGGPVGASLGSSLGGAAGGALFSDATLKDDIETLSDEDCYRAMMRISPHTFSWPNGKRDTGLIAQEVAQHLPQLIQKAEQGLLMVNYAKFATLLLGAFRHLAKGA